MLFQFLWPHLEQKSVIKHWKEKGLFLFEHADTDTEVGVTILWGFLKQNFVYFSFSKLNNCTKTMKMSKTFGIDIFVKKKCYQILEIFRLSYHNVKTTLVDLVKLFFNSIFP